MTARGGAGVSAFAGVLDQPLTRYVPGSSPRSTVALLEKELGITTVGQLLDHAPRRYIRRGKIQALSELVASTSVGASMAA